jgi:hypothetical protein
MAETQNKSALPKYRKINATTYQMTHVDESFEVRCVVKQEDGWLWSYWEGDDVALENPIAAWFLLDRRWEVDFVAEFSCTLEGQTD